MLAGHFVAGPGTRAAGPNPDAMSIDMNPTGAPTNTATSLGSREACARINENNMLDGDEDATADTLTLDVTVTNIPASNPMIAFNYVLNYDDTPLTVQTANHSFLLLANGGAAFNASESLPDTNNDGKWSASVVDVNINQPESGSGVLSRLTVASDVGAAAGEYPLTLTEALVIDQSETRLPDTINNASIAVNQACPLVKGDVDCSGSVLATDALSVLRHIAGLTVFQREPCPDIGTGGPPVQGDVDCTDSVLATDALKILRYVAALPIVQNDPCDDIGT